MSQYSTTRLVRFETRQPFSLALPNYDPALTHSNDGSLVYFTANRLLERQLGSAGEAVRIVTAKGRIPVLAPWDWPRAAEAGRVLFLLPSTALGDCVEAALFLRAFRQAHPAIEVTVANTGDATDIFGREEGLRVLPLLNSERELERQDAVIDIGQVSGWGNTATDPVYLEDALLQAFGLEPAVASLNRDREATRIGILPLTSSPLRTLPPDLCIALAEAFGPERVVTVALNSYQKVSAAYERTCRARLGTAVQIIPGFPTVGDLMDFLASCDFVVTGDSGPAHVTKLLGTSGLAVFTTVSGERRLGRHKNLDSYQVAYRGAHCSTPCGLAKVRETREGRIGCMGSLGCSLKDLKNVPSGPNADAVEELIFNDPVPCIAQLSRETEAVVARALELSRHAGA
ncbi:lipopolysaccharide heptosyltransferase family protein [Nisaea acidiphila]|uniref:Lipopolysaccharide heptosyltransferase family protein n=1 Tax=Nisaea acidiphila TaxID=1862145 RepID=A0A9J7ANX4_9PROT|nr:glycosyltransferase family 9 protein [Nisaea acidiphila]UUX49331.1 lipopolysaccharide heptosyltransferase family protein [Nisaea acidiphila]